MYLRLTSAVFPDNKRTGEVFFNEGCDRSTMNTFLVRLSKKLHAYFSDLKFTFQERMEIPAEFEANPVILAFCFAVCLHQQGVYYLQIKKETMMNYIFATMSDF